MKNYYCLGTSDSITENAINILKRRLDEKKYPLYRKTPFLKDVKKDDEVVFYVAGKKNKSQNFIAFSVIKSVEIPNELLIDPDKNKYILEKYLLFENITQESIQNIENTVRSGIEINFPNINITQLFITTDVNRHTVSINFSYEVINTGIQDEININFQNG